MSASFAASAFTAASSIGGTPRLVGLAFAQQLFGQHGELLARRLREPDTLGLSVSLDLEPKLVERDWQTPLERTPRFGLEVRERVVDLGHAISELDLDKQTGIVRLQEEAEVTCEFAEELMTTAQEALGRSVRVVGSRTDSTGRRRTILLVTRLEILDDAPLEPNEE